MKKRKKYERLGYSPAQKRELCERWTRGESLTDVARALGKRTSSVHTHLAQSGGIRPPERRRSRHVLIYDYEKIQRGFIRCAST